MDLSNNQISENEKSEQNQLSPNEDDVCDNDSYDNDEVYEDDDEPDSDDEQEEQIYEPRYENVNLLDSIAIARETFFFNYMDENEQVETVNERDVLKFIYEQVANSYTDVSLLEILGHIRHYYNLTFPEHERTVAMFYLGVYPQALMTDRSSAGIIRTDSQGNEIVNSFVQISSPGSGFNHTNQFNSSNPFATLFNNLINRANHSNQFDPSNLINPDISYNMIVGSDDEPTQSNRERLISPFTMGSQSIRGSSLLSEIMFLSTIFNMRSNESLLHVLNLMNNIMERTDDEEKQTATNEEIKELGTQEFSTVGLDYKEKNSEFCTICQENYSDDSNLKILPCGHFFHCECIEPWLLNCSNLCPICRKKI